MVGADVLGEAMQSIIGLDARDVAVKTLDELLSCIVLVHLRLPYQGNLTDVPTMTTRASTSRYIGDRNDRSITARIKDKAIRTSMTMSQGFMFTVSLPTWVSLPLASALAATLVLDVILEHEFDVRRQRTTICGGEFAESPF